ncbi:Syntaxin, N-terminal domain [Sesbania bispinosa]|nr:Syntaxin, N-terminal domain [Sesbania bispinosa]
MNDLFSNSFRKYSDLQQQAYLDDVEAGKKANEETIENLIASGESESFLQRAIQEQDRDKIMDTISEIQY